MTMPDDDPLDVLAAYRRLLDVELCGPGEIACSDGATLDALLAGVPVAEPAPFSGLIGSLGSVPIVIDETLPAGRVEIRDRDGRATRRLWRIGETWIDEDKLAEEAERVRRDSLTAYYRTGPFSGILAGPLYTGRLQPPGV
jgi:hypothetical protein